MDPLIGRIQRCNRAVLVGLGQSLRVCKIRPWQPFWLFCIFLFLTNQIPKFIFDLYLFVVHGFNYCVSNRF